MASGDTKTNQYLDIAANGTRADLPSDTCCETRTQTLIRGVAERIMDVEDEVERLENNPDVADIVATYADLQAYPTSQLTDKDVVRVLQDETHDGDSTYYRWSTSTNTWTYIGESKQYTDFVGTDGTSAGTAGLVPAPATTDAGKFLKADGTWDTAGGSSVNVVQTTGTSTTDVMSQNAVTSMVFADPGTNYQVKIGDSAVTTSGSAVAIGRSAIASTNRTVTIGSFAADGTQGAEGSVNIGYSANFNNSSAGQYSVAIGAGAKTTMQGEFNIGTSGTQETSTKGYNNTEYRLLTGVHDPVGDHDAATKGYVDSQSGGPTVVQTTGTSTTDVMSQNAVTSMVFSDTTTKRTIQIGDGASTGLGSESVSIGRNAYANGNESVCIGKGAGFRTLSRVNNFVAIGPEAGIEMSETTGSVSLGANSKATRGGEVNIGSTNTSYGYNSTNYRVLGGVHDGQDAHDAVTVSQVNSVIDAINTALSTNIPHIGA